MAYPTQMQPMNALQQMQTQHPLSQFGFNPMMAKQLKPKKPGFWSNVGSFFGGKSGQELQFQRFTPEQQFALMQLLSQGLSGLQNPYEGFAPIEEQATRQFSTETIPSLAERFTSLGGGQRSSAFQGALGSAASNLQSSLAALRSQYGMQNKQSALQQLGAGLTPQYESAYIPRQPGFFENLFVGGAQGLGSALPLLGRL